MSTCVKLNDNNVYKFWAANQFGFSFQAFQVLRLIGQFITLRRSIQAFKSASMHIGKLYPWPFQKICSLGLIVSSLFLDLCRVLQQTFSSQTLTYKSRVGEIKAQQHEMLLILWSCQPIFKLIKFSFCAVISFYLFLRTFFWQWKKVGKM